MLMGSHVDSVPNGGRFDGAAGVVAAAEVAQVLVQSGVELCRQVEVFAFANEESVRYAGGLMGRQALAGKFVDDSLLDSCDSAGVSLRSALADFGVAEPSLVAARRDAASVAAYFDLHVEQGGVLEEAGAPVGLVSGITGLYQARLELRGRSGHAGAKPMQGRRDPMMGFAQVAQKVEAVARASAGAVRGTVGWVSASPGAENVIPDSVRFSIDVRSVDGGALNEALQEVFSELKRVCGERDLSYEVLSEQHTEPEILDPSLRSQLEAMA